jgi:general stress protein YciG
MVGTKAGGILAAKKNLARDPLFYSKIGHKGGIVKGTMGGFAANPELARRVGAIGGSRSKRHKAVKTEEVK